MVATDVFGFTVKESTGNGGEFTPVLKYDAKAGRFFRMERIDTGNGFESEPVDITTGIKFIADFENIEVGWIAFPPASAPDFRLVPIGNQLPPQPSELHKNGIRFMLKLSKECGGERPIREIAGTSKSFRAAIEGIYLQYLAEKGKNPGKLPVLTVEKITPVKTGTGTRTSTNYHPVFRISGWAPRGDLVFEPKASAAPSVAPTTAPSTGSTKAAAPKADETVDSDFG
jgi:hypothetical protein